MKTLKSVIVLFLMLLWFCAAARAESPRAEVVQAPAPAKAVVVAPEDVLRVVVHSAEKSVTITLQIELDCNIAKLIEKHKDLTSKNPDGYKALWKFVREHLESRAKELAASAQEKDAIKKLPDPRP
jgi:hypothetical protein